MSQRRDSAAISKLRLELNKLGKAQRCLLSLRVKAEQREELLWFYDEITPRAGPRAPPWVDLLALEQLELLLRGRSQLGLTLGKIKQLFQQQSSF